MTGAFYSAGVSGFLRFVGIVNAAIWFGASIFFAGVVLPGIFSQDMHKVFRSDPRFTILRILSGRCGDGIVPDDFLCYNTSVVWWRWCICSPEKLYLGRAFPRLGDSDCQWER